MYKYYIVIYAGISLQGNLFIKKYGILYIKTFKVTRCNVLNIDQYDLLNCMV